MSDFPFFDDFSGNKESYLYISFKKFHYILNHFKTIETITPQITENSNIMQNFMRIYNIRHF